MVTSPQLTENAVTILRTRYLQEGETPEGLFRRVANAIAAPETEQEFWADQFYDLMADFEVEVPKLRPHKEELVAPSLSLKCYPACRI